MPGTPYGGGYQEKGMGVVGRRGGVVRRDGNLVVGVVRRHRDYP